MGMATVARPLVMRCGAFGDMVLLTALVRELNARFGQPVDLIASGPWTLPLLTGQPGVGEIFLLNSRKTPYWLSARQRALVRWLKMRGAGPTWFCDPNVGYELLIRGAIPPGNICDARALERAPHEHFVEYWQRFAAQSPQALADHLPAPASIGPAAAQLEIQPRQRQALARWLERHALAGRPLLLIQAGNKRTMRRGPRTRVSNSKYWPEERWAEVLRGLRRARPDAAIVLLGVSAEQALNTDIARLAGISDVHNVASDLPIEVLLPLLEKADSLVSVDTGPAHAAAVLGCPTVALFGASDPSLYQPGGTTTIAAVVTGEIDGERSMLGIEPESVLSAWRELTARRARPQQALEGTHGDR